MAINVRPSIVTSGLVLNLDAANMKSYPRSGTTWRDLSGLGNNGTLTNGPTFNSQNGGSIVFDGTNDRVECGNLGSLPNQGTIQYWMYSTAVENYRNVLTTGPINGTGGSTGNRAIRFEQYTTPTPYGGFNAMLGSDSATGLTGFTNFDYSPSASLNPNVWYHVSLTWNQSASNVTGHLNNILKFNSSCTTFPSTIPSLYIGVGCETSRYFKGNISNVLIYNKALTPSEVQQNYNATKTRFGLQ
jgi:hypothetical protein